MLRIIRIICIDQYHKCSACPFANTQILLQVSTTVGQKVWSLLGDGQYRRCPVEVQHAHWPDSLIHPSFISSCPLPECPRRLHEYEWMSAWLFLVVKLTFLGFRAKLFPRSGPFVMVNDSPTDVCGEGALLFLCSQHALYFTGGIAPESE